MASSFVWMLSSAMLTACALHGPAEAPLRSADQAARELIDQLGPQQTFARLGWQQNPDYQPPSTCFDYWSGPAEQVISETEINDCEAHARDLSRLFASYGTEAEALVFKSEYFWAQSDDFNINVFPQLVDAWKAAGGSEDDASFLKHPVCAEPLQEGWTGSDYFYDGREHPLCGFYKIEALEEE